MILVSFKFFCVDETGTETVIGPRTDLLQEYEDTRRQKSGYSVVSPLDLISTVYGTCPKPGISRQKERKRLRPRVRRKDNSTLPKFEIVEDKSFL